jgi:hypothetical protein
MFRNPVLLIDAAINLLLGVVLLAFRPSLAQALGIPQAKLSFYPTILGAMLFGIGLALLLECGGRPKGLVGLGLGGAITINLCGGIVLAIWLASGNLMIPMRGQVILWSLMIIVAVISATELYVHQRRLPTTRE